MDADRDVQTLIRGSLGEWIVAISPASFRLINDLGRVPKLLRPYVRASGRGQRALSRSNTISGEKEL